MAVFAASFRIEEVDTDIGTSGARRESVIEILRAQSDSMVWEETTSFILFNSPLPSASNIRQAVIDDALFDADVDVLLVINLSEKDYAPLGNILDLDIVEIMAKR